MMISLTNNTPKVNSSNFIASGSYLIGNVNLGENSSVWYNAVLRGDDNVINIGKNTNIQDLAVIHTTEKNPTIIGDYTTIGHSAILHACKIGDNCLIGMGATILDNVTIGNNCIIGSNSLVTSNTIIPDNSLAFGNPCKVIRELREEEINSIKENALLYVRSAKKYLEQVKG